MILCHLMGYCKEQQTFWERQEGGGGGGWRCEAFSDCSNWGWVGFLWTCVKEFSTGLRFCFSLKINILCLNGKLRFSNTPEILRLIWSFQQPIAGGTGIILSLLLIQRRIGKLWASDTLIQDTAVRWQRCQHRSLNSISTGSRQPDFSV